MISFKEVRGKGFSVMLSVESFSQYLRAEEIHITIPKQGTAKNPFSGGPDGPSRTENSARSSLSYFWDAIFGSMKSSLDFISLDVECFSFYVSIS
jgi:hypothetical protein